jgi:hypothetical protein
LFVCEPASLSRDDIHIVFAENQRGNILIIKRIHKIIFVVIFLAEEVFCQARFLIRRPRKRCFLRPAQRKKTERLVFQRRQSV